MDLKRFNRHPAPLSMNLWGGQLKPPPTLEPVEPFPFIRLTFSLKGNIIKGL